MVIGMIDYRKEDKEDLGEEKIKVLAENFDEGKLYTRYDWTAKLVTKEDKIKYLKTALRYWYSNEWYGSEKPK